MVLISKKRAIFVAVLPHFDRIRDIFASILFSAPYFIEIRTKLVAIFGGLMDLAGLVGSGGLDGFDGLGGLGEFGGIDGLGEFGGIGGMMYLVGLASLMVWWACHAP